MNTKASNFRLNIALDTNIIAYLVDNTYPKLTAFINVIKEYDLVEIEFPGFAQYEFIGIRKLEHYLRCLIKLNTSKTQVNLSSALKYKNQFNAPELHYNEAEEQIKQFVDKDFKKIAEEFNIMFLTEEFQWSFWEPFQDLVLSTTISKEDCLVLLTTILPKKGEKNKYKILLTNDTEFSQILEKFENTKDIFAKHDLALPVVCSSKAISGIDGTNVNLCENNSIKDQKKIKILALNFVLKHLKEKFYDLFLGEVFKCECSKTLKKKLICFEIQPGTLLNRDMYISVIVRNGLKIHNHPVPISECHCDGVHLNLPHQHNGTESAKISIELVNKDGSLLDQSLIKAISEKGNLVFMHPDSA